MTRQRLVWIVAFLVSAPETSAAVVYSVSPGDELQATADRLRAGDTLRFAAGTYRRPIVIRAKGTKENPIRIDGDGQTRFSGLVELRLEWRPHRNGIYKADVDHPVHQLFVDGQLMTPARWPNMTFDERWDDNKWPSADEGTSFGGMVDSDLATSGADFTGCVAILNIGSHEFGDDDSKAGYKPTPYR